MTNIFDYLKWRGDLSFQKDGFNEVDNLILANLAYIDYEGIVPSEPGRGVTMARASEQLRTLGRPPLKGIFQSRYPELLAQAAETDRFKNVTLSCYIAKLDEKVPNQFAALIFSLSDREHYIAFRGTDDNLAGWKEDFLMSFKYSVLAQRQAAAYLNKYSPRYRGRIYTGGHSKGGNLAVFASVHTSDRLRNKIAAVYNNDGPGFQAPLLQTEGYKKIESRVRTIIPNSSVIGLLLEHSEDYTIVASSENVLLSHNPLTWGVCGSSFIYEQELSKQSRQINEAVRAWLGKLSLEQREQFTEALFDIIRASGAQTFSDLTKERLQNIDAMTKKFWRSDRETRKMLRDVVINFFNIRQRLMFESLTHEVEALFVKKT